MLRRLSFTAILAIVVLAFAPGAFASGGIYTIGGGTKAEQLNVRAALDASTFPWAILPGSTAIHISSGGGSYASPGQVFLDATLLDTGRFSWGVVQHEMGHQVDFTLLTDAQRTTLAPMLGGAYWSSTGITEGHAQANCERFADMIAWAYWPSLDDVMRPVTAGDENYGISPTAFRTAVEAMLPQILDRRILLIHPITTKHRRSSN